MITPLLLDRSQRLETYTKNSTPKLVSLEGDVMVVRPASVVVSSQLDSVVALLRGRRSIVITGAGVSTDSGIPDYRGEGTPERSPMTFQQFLGAVEYRKRYWAGSHLGWRQFGSAEPNAGHRALAELESLGIINGVITQNVDGLHSRAGSQRVVELHGSMGKVRCLECGQSYARESVAERMLADNPWLISSDSIPLSPDGDVRIDDVAAMVVPECTVCSGVLKPDVVFFGEFVPRSIFEEARALVQRADALVVAGSSLIVNSGVRLLGEAVRRKIPIVIINRGVTKGDARAHIKLEAGTSETLDELLHRLA